MQQTLVAHFSRQKPVGDGTAACPGIWPTTDGVTILTSADHPLNSTRYPDGNSGAPLHQFAGRGASTVPELNRQSSVNKSFSSS